LPDINNVASFDIGSGEEALALFGKRDENIKYVERETGVHFICRNGEVNLSGRLAPKVAELMTHLRDRIRQGEKIGKSDIKYGLIVILENNGDEDLDGSLNFRLSDSTGHSIKPKSPRQREYLNALAKSDLTFAIGPAGTGKTYLAVAMAVKFLNEESVKRIIICRPAVEAGEKLGFLPGDFQQKVDPYLRPIYDALFGLLGVDKCARLLERGVIEIAPLAFMRGRTLEDAFVIMDEAQNTTIEQMKMFLTRLGRRSRAAVTGDVTQIDLPHDKVSGLVDSIDRLKSLDEIRFVFFTRNDVVRHDLVAKIIEAYEDKSLDEEVRE